MIADELGFTKAAIYHHFRTREQLLTAVLEPIIGKLRSGGRGRRAAARYTRPRRADAQRLRPARGRKSGLGLGAGGRPRCAQRAESQPRVDDIIARQLALLADVDPGPQGFIRARFVFAGIAGSPVRSATPSTGLAASPACRGRPAHTGTAHASANLVVRQRFRMNEVRAQSGAVICQAVRPPERGSSCPEDRIGDRRRFGDRCGGGRPAARGRLPRRDPRPDSVRHRLLLRRRRHRPSSDRRRTRPRSTPRWGRSPFWSTPPAATRSAGFTDISFERVAKIIDINLHGVFHTIQAVLPDMIEAGWGRIVNISSSSTHSGVPYMSAYVAAKSGVNGLTKSLALEYGPAGITVNAVPPGFIDTPMLRKRRGARKPRRHPGQHRRHTGTADRQARGHRGRLRVLDLRGGRLHHRPDPRRQRRPQHLTGLSRPASRSGSPRSSP